MAYFQFSSAQSLQNQAIKAFGHVVKNTFIDDVAPPSPAAARRACSVPAASRTAGDGECDEAVCVSSCPPFAARRGRTTGCDEDLCNSKCRDLSLASTTSTRTSTDTATSCSTATHRNGFSWAEASVSDSVESTSTVEEDPIKELTALVKRECAFMRLTEEAVYEETSPVRMQRGVVKCVIFYCRGLPWAKRSKWLLPLLWSVAAVLKKSGCAARVQSGELYAQIPGDASGELVRLDFAASRV